MRSNTKLNLVVPALGLLGAVFAVATANGQCPDRWVSSAGRATVNGTVLAIAKWHPPGSTTQDSLLVVGGTFSLAGLTPVNSVAAYSSATDQWMALGSGVGGQSASVYCLATLPTGELVAGGTFTTAGGSDARFIAKWDGNEWSPLGSGMNNSVFAIALLPSGQLVAGGHFTTAGGVSALRIASWDGAQWSPMDSGMTGPVRALVVLPGGQLIAGGSFGTAGSVNAQNIASWNGFFWSPLGFGLNSHVFALAAPSSGRWAGTLFAAGNFTSAGGEAANFVAKWDGSEWSGLGVGLEYQAYALDVLPDRVGGGLVVGGNFNSAGGAAGTNALARWDGSRWSSMGMGLAFPAVQAIGELPNGELAVGGSFDSPAGVPARFARFEFARLCRADFDCSGGTPTVDDLFAFLGAWFASNPSADFNGVDGLNVQDIFDYLAAWFAGC